MNKRIMLIGYDGIYKSLLWHYLEHGKFKHAGISKQCIVYGQLVIDTPAAYLGNPFMYDALIALSQQASIVLFVKKISDKYSKYPPGFSKAFQGRHIGVLIEDGRSGPADVFLAKQELLKMGVSNTLIYTINQNDLHSFEHLKEVCFGMKGVLNE